MLESLFLYMEANAIPDFLVALTKYHYSRYPQYSETALLSVLELLRREYKIENPSLLEEQTINTVRILGHLLPVYPSSLWILGQRKETLKEMVTAVDFCKRVGTIIASRDAMAKYIEGILTRFPKTTTNKGILLYGMLFKILDGMGLYEEMLEIKIVFPKDIKFAFARLSSLIKEDKVPTIWKSSHEKNLVLQILTSIANIPEEFYVKDLIEKRFDTRDYMMLRQYTDMTYNIFSLFE